MRTLLVIAGILLVVLLQGYLLPPHTAAPPLPARLVGDSQWLNQAEQLAWLRLPLYLSELALPPLVLWSFIRGGAAARLQRRLRERGLRNQWLLVGVYGCLIWLGLRLLNLPLSYAAYRLRVAYGLSNQPQLAWLGRQALQAAIEIGPLVVVLEGLYWLLRVFPRRWWIPASIGSILFSLCFAYLTPLVITPLLFTQQPLADTALRAKIVDLAARIGIMVDEIYVIDASTQGTEANAYVIGIGGSARIVLYDTLLADYPQDEVLAVLAHEMGHWRQHHIWQGLALSFVATPFGLAALHVTLRRVLPRWGIRRPSDVAGLPLLLLLLHLATITTLPAQNWLSRRWEAEADQIALAANPSDPTLAELFARLARQNLSDPTPPRLIETLFATHPAIGRRVAAVLAGTTNP